MKVQKIANTSIFTRKNDNSTTVSFSGKNPRASKSMPKYSAKLAKGAEKKPDTVLEELSTMAKNLTKRVKKSFEKSEINKVIVQPVKRAWGDFSKKAPILSKGIKATAVVAMGVGLFEAVKGKISE